MDTKPININFIVTVFQHYIPTATKKLQMNFLGLCAMGVTCQKKQ